MPDPASEPALPELRGSLLETSTSLLWMMSCDGDVADVFFANSKVSHLLMPPRLDVGWDLGRCPSASPAGRSELAISKGQTSLLRAASEAARSVPVFQSLDLFVQTGDTIWAVPTHTPEVRRELRLSDTTQTKLDAAIQSEAECRLFVVVVRRRRDRGLGPRSDRNLIMDAGAASALLASAFSRLGMSVRVRWTYSDEEVHEALSLDGHHNCVLSVLELEED